MSKAARSVFVFGVYLYVVGTALLLVPNAFLALNRMAPAQDVWIRVVGILVLCLAFYYTQAARAGLAEFFRFTVPVRAAVCLAFLALVVLRLAEPPLALFGLVDLAGGVWTGLALRKG